MKALIINKIGDVFLLLGIILLYLTYGSLNILFINCTTNMIDNEYILNIPLTNISIDNITLSILCIIIGVCAKSAQIGLHT